MSETRTPDFVAPADRERLRRNHVKSRESGATWCNDCEDGWPCAEMRMLDALERVEALHQPSECYDACSYPHDCKACLVEWPCPTALAVGAQIIRDGGPTGG